MGSPMIHCPYGLIRASSQFGRQWPLVESILLVWTVYALKMPTISFCHSWPCPYQSACSDQRATEGYFSCDVTQKSAPDKPAHWTNLYPFHLGCMSISSHLTGHGTAPPCACSSCRFSAGVCLWNSALVVAQFLDSSNVYPLTCKYFWALTAGTIALLQSIPNQRIYLFVPN